MTTGDVNITSYSMTQGEKSSGDKNKAVPKWFKHSGECCLRDAKVILSYLQAGRNYDRRHKLLLLMYACVNL